MALSDLINLRLHPHRELLSASGKKVHGRLDMLSRKVTSHEWGDRDVLEAALIKDGYKLHCLRTTDVNEACEWFFAWCRRYGMTIREDKNLLNEFNIRIDHGATNDDTSQGA